MRKIIAALTVSLFASNALGYDPATHEILSKAATNKSILTTSQTFQKLGLSAVLPDSGVQLFPNSNGEFDTVMGLIQFGSIYEDTRRPWQALYHFYDPSHGGRGLTVFGFVPGAPSPDWALEDNADFGTSQPFSFKKGRKYFYDALTKPTLTDRNTNWGLTFQTLGHVIHHLQDMAQPQHTRNDLHCDKIVPCGIPGAFLGLYSVPRYEDYTRDLGEALPFNSVPFPPVYSANDTATFNSPRKFWVNGGKGIAEFSNRNFVTQGTNFSMLNGPVSANANFSLPAPGTPFDEPMSNLFSIANPAPAGILSACNQE